MRNINPKKKLDQRKTILYFMLSCKHVIAISVNDTFNKNSVDWNLNLMKPEGFELA